MVTTDTRQTSPLEAARTLAPLIRAKGAQIERDRELPPEVVDGLLEARLFRMLIPRSLNGLEIDYPTYVEVIEEISRADASTAWCLNQGSVFATNSAFLPHDVADAIWGRDPRAVVANGPSPTAQAHAVEGGYRVTGRWTFSSGCLHATWLAGFAPFYEDAACSRPLVGPKGRPIARYLLFPKSDARVIDTWNVAGLRGTGSNNFAVTELFVPGDRTVWTYSDQAVEPGPIYVIPLVALFAGGFAAVALGAARGAIDDLIDLASGKTRRGEDRVMRDQGLVQSQVAHAEAHYRSGRAFLLETVHKVWDSVRATGQVTLDDRILMRLAMTHAIHLAAQAVDLVYSAAGASAIFSDNPIQRRWQDVHVVTQHVQARLAHYETVGRHFLGLDVGDRQWI